MSSRLSQFVRQEIPPPIRPAPPQPAVAEDTDDTGFAVLSGGSGRLIDLAFTYSHNMSRSRRTEIKRKVDKVRIKQMDDEGNVNDENFIDVEVPKKIVMEQSDGTDEKDTYAAPVPAENIEIVEENLWRYNLAKRFEGGGGGAP